jgi:hypothetical protein
MNRFKHRLEEAKRVFLEEVSAAAEEEAIELVRAAFASVKPVRAPDPTSPSVKDASTERPAARTGPQAARTNTSASSVAVSIAVPPAVAAACSQITACVVAHPGISARELATKLGMHSDKVRNALRVLTSKGAVRFTVVNKRKGGQVRSYFPTTPAPIGDALSPDLAPIPDLAVALVSMPMPDVMPTLGLTPTSDLIPLVEQGDRPWRNNAAGGDA